MRFRKSIKIGGGTRVNLSKSGIGFSVGTKGARLTSKTGGGTRTTLSVPGTGISYVSDSRKGRASASKPKASDDYDEDSEIYAILKQAGRVIDLCGNDIMISALPEMQHILICGER